MWELIACEDAWHEIEKLCKDGWEPFAVVHEPNDTDFRWRKTMVWFRRKKK